MITGIEHIAIFAKDSEKLSAWYADTLDGKIVFDNGEGAYFVAFSDKSMIEFCPANDKEFPAPDFTDSGLRHLAISVDDFDSAVEKVKKLGVEVLREIDVSTSGVSTFFFADPEGNILHFISRPQPLI